MTKVSTSYSLKDKDFTGRFTQALQKSELDTWIDWEDIPPTTEWMEQIHKGIEEADAFLFLLSPEGKTLIPSSRDNTIIIWGIDPESWVEANCQLVGRSISAIRCRIRRYIPFCQLNQKKFQLHDSVISI